MGVISARVVTRQGLTTLAKRSKALKIEFEPPITWFYFLGIIKLTIKLYKYQATYRNGALYTVRLNTQGLLTPINILQTHFKIGDCDSLLENNSYNNWRVHEDPHTTFFLYTTGRWRC